MKNFGYSSSEKLKSKAEISLLFEKGKWKSFGSLRIIFLKNENLTANKIGVSVPKRNFKKAVHRNRIKRLLREAYRLHKTEFSTAFGENTLAMIFWNSPSLPCNFHEVEEEFLKFCQSRNKKLML